MSVSHALVAHLYAAGFEAPSDFVWGECSCGIETLEGHTWDLDRLFKEHVRSYRAAHCEHASSFRPNGSDVFTCDFCGEDASIPFPAVWLCPCKACEARRTPEQQQAEVEYFEDRALQAAERAFGC